MTGEMTLSGVVLPVGRIKEKCEALREFGALGGAEASARA